jgi:hypothetical protein
MVANTRLAAKNAVPETTAANDRWKQSSGATTYARATSSLVTVNDGRRALGKAPAAGGLRIPGATAAAN